MEFFLASLTIFSVAFLAMSLGVLAGRPPIRSSCGGNCVNCARGCANRAGQNGTEQS